MRTSLAPFLFVCPGCDAKVRTSSKVSVVKHRCPRRRQRVVRYRLTAEPDGCKVKP